ncbi:hypothetical protein BOTBODRAFT_368375 [Botryobasidium botryosum FD-172 SS1]|uniref:Uncharacterized protein n=1 Tax=Botryobasidium botryosum (strain FD-172 SS1) TaxID=930990 RepID=A0A067MD42_BOTB1|nr:hypothetical protein BOTBODRAFT_368375 [Botryobasidium botryosum FD-172 SS1]
MLELRPLFIFLLCLAFAGTRIQSTDPNLCRQDVHLHTLNPISELGSRTKSVENRGRLLWLVNFSSLSLRRVMRIPSA